VVSLLGLLLRATRGGLRGEAVRVALDLREGGRRRVAGHARGKGGKEGGSS